MAVGLSLVLMAAFAIGMAEASFFFIVPDVVISYVALKYGFRNGLTATGLAVLGAMIGATIAYFWGVRDLAGAQAFYDSLPAINPATIARAEREMGEPDVVLALIKGSVSGVPFKLYASAAGANGFPLWQFLALTPLARLPRFLLAAGLWSAIGRWGPSVARERPLLMMAGIWGVFYAIYWTLTPA